MHVISRYIDHTFKIEVLQQQWPVIIILFGQDGINKYIASNQIKSRGYYTRQTTYGHPAYSLADHLKWFQIYLCSGIFDRVGQNPHKRVETSPKKCPQNFGIENGGSFFFPKFGLGNKVTVVQTQIFLTDIRLYNPPFSFPNLAISLRKEMLLYVIDTQSALYYILFCLFAIKQDLYSCEILLNCTANGVVSSIISNRANNIADQLTQTNSIYIPLHF